MNALCHRRRRTGFWIAIAVAIAAASSVGHHSHDKAAPQQPAQGAAHDAE